MRIAHYFNVFMISFLSAKKKKESLRLKIPFFFLHLKMLLMPLEPTAITGKSKLFLHLLPQGCFYPAF